ncbi:MAG TPA: pre-peptidase C-terminal domain-containing protein [Myxococcales bacterium]
MSHLPRRERLPLLLLLPIATLLACAGQVADTGDDKASIMRGAEVSSALRHDDSPPLTLMPIAPSSGQRVEHEVKKLPRRFSTHAAFDPVAQLSAPALLIPATSKNFDGVGNGFAGPSGTFTVNAAPPDTNGDVGPNHYVQTVNTDFAVFNKSGTPVYGPVPINTLWSNFGGGCQTNNDGDPVVIYDPIADRWVISQFSVTGANGATTPFLQCVAVSQTADPTGAYYRYSFPYTGFNDYPKMGVWPDGYYITFNMFNATGTAFLGSKVCAYDRAKMLTGAPATQHCFDTSTAYGGLLPADLDGSRLPPTGAPNYVLALGATANTLAFWKFHVDWTTPSSSTFTGPTTLNTAAYSEACAGGTCIPQSGTTQKLDSLADRLMFRLAYRNFADHEALVVNHSITAGSSTGVRWYEVRVAGGTPSIFQQGTYAPDASYRWMGSIALDQAGNMGLGFSTSSSSLHPEIRYTGRLAGDAPGQMTQGEGTIIAGLGSQTGSNLARWGDYSMMAVDPVDDCTFWFTTEYIPANGAFNWRTRIGSFKFPGCGAAPVNDFSISANPTSLTLAPNATGTSSISTTLVSGTAETINLTVSGTPAGASASVSPTSVTTGGSSTLTVNAGTAAAGTYTLTVTGTAPGATHSTPVTLTVQSAPPANDFAISSNPASLGLVSGGSGTSSISTTVLTGAAESISLSITGAPSGASASLNPTSVTAGGSSTLTVNAGTAAAGNYTLTVTGTAPSATHSTTVTLAIRDFSIAVSPSSATVAAGQSTNYTVTTTALNGSTQSIALSVSGLPTGVTGSFNPGSVTAGGSSTLTLTAAASAPAATATFTVTGSSAPTTHTATATVTVTTPSGDTQISNGVPVSNLSGAVNSQQFFYISVPAGQATLTVQISGGTGDADLYTRFGSRPTLATYDCRPYITGNNETCTVNNPAAGNYYIMLNGYTAYSGVTLKATYAADTTTALTNGVPVTAISGASGSQQFWKLAVPTGQAKVVFTISGGTGDADLYVRRGARPTTTTYDCRPYLTGNNETCTITSPVAGDYFVMLRGYTAYSGVTLKGQYP